MERVDITPRSPDRRQLLVRTPSRYLVFDFGKAEFVEVSMVNYRAFRNVRFMEFTYPVEDFVGWDGDPTIEMDNLKVQQ